MASVSRISLSRKGERADEADSMLDGTPTLRLNEFMLGGIDAGKIPLELSEGEKATSLMPKPEEITFELDRHLQSVIEKSKRGFEDEMGLQDLEVSSSTLTSDPRGTSKLAELVS